MAFQVFSVYKVYYKNSSCNVLQNVDGVNYLHVKQAGLLFVATTRVNPSPALVLELLQRIARVTKDYLGILNEDSLRKNFVLVYELLDEMIVSLCSATMHQMCTVCIFFLMSSRLVNLVWAKHLILLYLLVQSVSMVQKSVWFRMSNDVTLIVTSYCEVIFG